jgi:Family of unknown function (DUF5763)
MLFKPKYCCNCSEKIERAEWRLWTSRRFCQLCETEFKPYDLLPRAVVVAGLVFVLFGLGSYFRSQNMNAASARISASSIRSTQKLKPAQNRSVSTEDSNSRPSASGSETNSDEPIKQINEQPKQEKASSDETVYYCGALTKKGTPCTRRVKKKGFCWQHARSSQIGPTRFQ